jgi:threonylcarbamoyladenosine tRNA methylthiotransferase MtaB
LLTLENVEGYHVENFGCRASHADGDGLSAELAQVCGPALPAEHAAVVVLNTCAVTAESERHARAYMRRVRRANREARIIVTGCYAQRAPHEVAALPDVDAVVGNSHKALLAQVAFRLAGTAQPVPLVAIADVRASTGVPIFADDRFAHANLAAEDLSASVDTRPNLKVQDGCGNRCAFCIIPTTRGSSRSEPLAAVLQRVRRFVHAGGKELVLSGINLGRWGRDLNPSARFEELVAAILRETALPRLRISSVEPMDWSANLLSLYREYGADNAASTGPRLARHAHLPLQSGADAILRGMHRRYRPWHYAEKLAAIREVMPGAAIGADVMVGFPGETDALFEESCRFVAQQPFTYLHLFPFSARPGTAASQHHREHPVAGEAVRDRMARLRALADEKNAAFRRRAEQKQLSVVTLKAKAEHDRRTVTPAVSDNFLHIEICGKFSPNQMLWVAVSNGESARDGSATAWHAIPI